MARATRTTPQSAKPTLTPIRIAEVSLYPPGPRPLQGPDAIRNATDWNLNCHGDTRCCNCHAGLIRCFDPGTCAAKA